jgi:hypothetical protein
MNDKEKDLLINALAALANLTDIVEEQMPDFYSSSDAIMEIDDVFKEADELGIKYN